MPSLGDAQVEAELLDATGRVVRSFGAAVRGSDRVIINTSDLSAGRYSIRLSGAGSRITLPLSVVR
ncbi:MAG: T9SS type A sorting domain-containing protein [Flavobacteriales bacterium]|nr:T9SS type A sorting domain-containing protein [Flavobacteriales bacterium]